MSADNSITANPAPLLLLRPGDPDHGVDLAHLAYTDDSLDIPLTLLDGEFAQERWQTSGLVAHSEFEGAQVAAGDQVCCVRMHIPEHPDGVAAGADLAYDRLRVLGQHLGFTRLLRVWHYLHALNDGAGDQERYKQFCLGRARALERSNVGHAQLPAATLVGSRAPGLRVHALLVRSPPAPLENPRQVSAYLYPREYGPRQPAFARAALMPWPQGPTQLFVSGTASIVGHRSRHTEDLAGQLDESLRNLRSLLELASARMGALAFTDLDFLKVYLRRPQDLALARQHLTAAVGTQLPLVFLHAALCRQELLVEIETQVTRRPVTKR